MAGFQKIFVSLPKKLDIMNTTTQFIKDANGNNLLAVLPVEDYNELLYNGIDFKNTQDIPQWHKEILDQDLENLEVSLSENNSSDNWTWEEIENEIKQKYGY